MSSRENNGITIEISGEENTGKTLVGCIIHKALTKSGFTDVTMTDQEGEAFDPYEPKTVLDLVQAARPELFATPIGIVEVTENYGDEEAVELNDIALVVAGDPAAAEMVAADPMSEALSELDIIERNFETVEDLADDLED